MVTKNSSTCILFGFSVSANVIADCRQNNLSITHKSKYNNLEPVFLSKYKLV